MVSGRPRPEWVLVLYFARFCRPTTKKPAGSCSTSFEAQNPPPRGVWWSPVTPLAVCAPAMRPRAIPLALHAHDGHIFSASEGKPPPPRGRAPSARRPTASCPPSLAAGRGRCCLAPDRQVSKLPSQQFSTVMWRRKPPVLVADRPLVARCRLSRPASRANNNHARASTARQTHTAAHKGKPPPPRGRTPSARRPTASCPPSLAAGRGRCCLAPDRQVSKLPSQQFSTVMWRRKPPVLVADRPLVARCRLSRPASRANNNHAHQRHARHLPLPTKKSPLRRETEHTAPDGHRRTPRRVSSKEDRTEGLPQASSPRVSTPPGGYSHRCSSKTALRRVCSLS